MSAGSGEVRDVASRHAKRAVRILRETMADGRASANARVAAASRLIDVAYGKAVREEGGGETVDDLLRSLSVARGEIDVAAD